MRGERRYCHREIVTQNTRRRGARDILMEKFSQHLTFETYLNTEGELLPLLRLLHLLTLDPAGDSVVSEDPGSLRGNFF